MGNISCEKVAYFPFYLKMTVKDLWIGQIKKSYPVNFFNGW